MWGEKIRDRQPYSYEKLIIMKISARHLIGGILIGLILLSASFFSLPDTKLHLVFCDVGQGDAIYVRTPGGEDILIDAGPNDKVLACLGKHMPFYDRSIELVFLSHPQADHLNGLISVIERYNVDYFVSSGIGNTTEGYKKLAKLLSEKNVLQKKVFAGEKIGLDNVGLKILWPEKGGVLAATSPTDVNELSLVLKLSYGQFDALLTGDAGQDVQEQLALNPASRGEWEVLKVPHHGSKTSLLASFLEEIKPALAVISVGKNSYGHPAKETLEVLRNYEIKILRTDKDGEIEIISDGKKWWRKN